MSAKKVLLVDDSETILMMHRLMLRDSGYELVIARNGREAVETAVAVKPDLIVMDVMMPEMTGFEACQAMREKEETRTLPIILVTTKGDPQKVEAGYSSGCTDYMTKPINRAEMLTKLRKYLGE